MQWIKDNWAIVAFAFGIAVAAGVANFRIALNDERLKKLENEPTKIEIDGLKGDVKRIKCEVQNVKFLLKGKDEQLCI